MEELNKNQKLFCMEYVKSGCNGTSAYLSVYKCKKDETARVNASKLLTNANVQKYVQELQDKIEAETIMDIKERKKYLTKILNDSITETAYDMFGNDFQKKPSFKTKLTAIDILNKMDGVYTTNVNVKENTVSPFLESIARQLGG